MLLTFFDVGARAHYLNARQTLARLLDWRVVPVVNENDTTATDEISFGDNDFLAAQVAILVGADLLVLLTAVDGLYTADPRRDPAAQLVRGRYVERRPTSRGSRSAHDDGRSVGRHALEGRRRRDGHRRRHPDRRSATALRPGALRRVLGGGRPGTRFEAQAARHSSFKLWLQVRQARAGRGARRRRRRAGAARRRDVAAARRGRRRPRRRSTPATPSRSAPAGAVIGKGISNYSAAELRRVKGLKSADVRERAAAGDRGGRPPRLLRAGVSELVASPLLVPHVAQPGRRGRAAAAGPARGRRLRPGRRGPRRAPSRRWYGEPPALVHAYNDELRRAARGGLTSRPEPAPLSVEAFSRLAGDG